MGILVMVLVPGRAVETTTYVVDTTADDAGKTAGTGSSNDCSLCGAITAANSAGGTNTITLPAGTYNLTIAGGSENANHNIIHQQ